MLLFQPHPIALDPSDRISPSVLQFKFNLSGAILVVTSHAFLAGHGVAPVLEHLRFVDLGSALATEQRQFLIIDSHTAPIMLCVRVVVSFGDFGDLRSARPELLGFLARGSAFIVQTGYSFGIQLTLSGSFPKIARVQPSFAPRDCQ